MSDAALAVYHESQREYANGGQVAYPSVTGTLAFSVTVTVTDLEATYQGQPVHKIGAWGGRSVGTVDYACADVYYPGSNELWKLLCQSRATYSADTGDSGSPILAVHADGTASGVGIHWGYPGWFSALSGALDELYDANESYGTMDATGTPPSPPPALSASLTGPSSVKPNWTCVWTVSASGGLPPYSYTWSINGTQVSNGSPYPYELLYQNTGTGFTVSVQVSDANPFHAPVTKQKNVSVSSGAPSCYS